MIKVSQLLKTVPTADGDLTILHGVDLEIVAGTSAAIVGASGSGKSTLLGLLAGMDVASAGEVWLDGVNLSALDEDARARLRAERVGFVFQNFQLLPALTAKENVMLPLELAGIDEAGSIAERFLGEVGLQDRLGHYPATLSGGEQQRVAIDVWQHELRWRELQSPFCRDDSAQRTCIDILRAWVADHEVADRQRGVFAHMQERRLVVREPEWRRPCLDRLGKWRGIRAHAEHRTHQIW